MIMNVKPCARCGKVPLWPSEFCKEWERVEGHPGILKGHRMDGRDVYQVCDSGISAEGALVGVRAYYCPTLQEAQADCGTLPTIDP